MAVTEERLKRLGFLEPWIFEYEFRDIFPRDVFHTRQALTKWLIKVPKLTQDGMLNLSSWYKPRVTFTAAGLQWKMYILYHGFCRIWLCIKNYTLTVRVTEFVIMWHVVRGPSLGLISQYPVTWSVLATSFIIGHPLMRLLGAGPLIRLLKLRCAAWCNDHMTH